MMYLFAACTGVFTAELLARMVSAGIHTRMAETAHKALFTLRRGGVSDHWKQRVLLPHACALFRDTCRLAVFLVLGAGVVGALVFLARRVDVDLVRFLITPIGLIFVTVVAAAYLFVRKHLVR